eukprot:5257677-Alexandrium_andersonii.AAC.1
MALRACYLRTCPAPRALCVLSALARLCGLLSGPGLGCGWSGWPPWGCVARPLCGTGVVS